MMKAKMKVLQALMNEMGDMEASKLKPKKMEDEPMMDPIELLKQTLEEGKPVGVVKKAVIIKKNPEDSMEEESDDMEEEDDDMEEEDSKSMKLRDMIRKMKGI